MMSNLCPDFVRSKGRCGPQTLLRAPHPSSAPVRGGKGAQRGQDGGSPRCSLRGWVASAPLLPPSSSSKADVGCDTPAPSSPKPSSLLKTSPTSPPGRYLQAPPPSTQPSLAFHRCPWKLEPRGAAVFRALIAFWGPAVAIAALHQPPGRADSGACCPCLCPPAAACTSWGHGQAVPQVLGGSSSWRDARPSPPRAFPGRNDPGRMKDASHPFAHPALR